MNLYLRQVRTLLKFDENMAELNNHMVSLPNSFEKFFRGTPNCSKNL